MFRRSRLHISALTGIALFLFALPAAFAQTPSLKLSRPVRSWEFLPVVGQRAALFGHESGDLEAWVYPLKIFRDFHLRLVLNGRTIPAESLARTLITRPESTTIVYGGDDFSIREELFVPVHEQGAILTFTVDTAEPLDIEAAFTPDFQLEWPAALGATYFNWDPALTAFVFGEETKKYVAIIGSPSARDAQFAYDTNYSSSSENSFRLGLLAKGHQTYQIAIAASTNGAQEAIQSYQRILGSYANLLNESASYYRKYLDQTVRLKIPDQALQDAYDWSRISTVQGLVENPSLGTGLVAGYRTSGTSQRPGFAWYFGRDSLWTSFALNAEGDFATTRTALEFLSKFQREDGRFPHEIAQSAYLVDWFKGYPYGFASADATPLYIIGVDDYVTQSGDTAFAQQHWDQCWKAYQFLRSTYNAQNFPQNFGVGHGWVEGGPLLPISTEFYQSGLGLEAVRALAHLAQLTGKNDVNRELSQAFDQQRPRFEEAFWISGKNAYAFALDREGRRVDEPSVLTTVPMWFGLTDPAHTESMIDQLASPDHAADWGMRIISTHSQKYNGSGYHFGSVWPLFTGWAAVGEYRYHRAHAAYSNLRANALLAFNNSLGHVTEVLSGDVNESLSTASPHQIWSAAMVLSPMLRGLFGLEADASANQLTFAPHLPADWPSCSLEHVRVGSTTVDLVLTRSPNLITLETTASAQTTVLFSPAVSLRTKVISAELNGKKIAFQVSPSGADQHVAIRIPASTTKGSLRLRLKDDFAIDYPNALPALGAHSEALHIVSEEWNASHTQLTLKVSGLPGHRYDLAVWNPSSVASAEGENFFGSRGDIGTLSVDFRTQAATDFQTRSIVLHFRTDK